MQQAGDLSLEQILHVTTCDIEPSIIARNIILYKLVYDENDPSTMKMILQWFGPYFMVNLLMSAV